MGTNQPLQSFQEPYIAPNFEIIEMSVEKGFAATDLQNGMGYVDDSLNDELWEDPYAY